MNENELEADKRDAERYRYLRSRFDACAAWAGFFADDAGKHRVDVEQDAEAGRSLDAAIDDALASSRVAQQKEMDE